MFLHVSEARYAGGHKVWLRFNDGAEGEVDLGDELDGEVFEPLKDVEVFKTFRLEGHTVSWSNGADFAPEFLRDKLKKDACAPMVAEDEAEYGGA